MYSYANGPKNQHTTLDTSSHLVSEFPSYSTHILLEQQQSCIQLQRVYLPVEWTGSSKPRRATLSSTIFITLSMILLFCRILNAVSP